MNQKETKSPTRKSRGAILLLTTILLFIILGMVVSLSYITVMEQKMSGKTKSSVGAFYNSESGVEWALNQIATKTGTISSAFSGKIDTTTGKVTCPDFGSGNNCDVYLLDSDGKVINNSNLNITPGEDISEVKAVRSVGNQGGETQRAIEAAVASSSNVKAGESFFASGSCGDSSNNPCSIDISSGNFSSAPKCTISMVNSDGTGYTENMVIQSITTTALKVWKGENQNEGTNMWIDWICAQ